MIELIRAAAAGTQLLPLAEWTSAIKSIVEDCKMNCCPFFFYRIVRDLPHLTPAACRATGKLDYLAYSKVQLVLEWVRVCAVEHEGVERSTNR
jgi:hypothetical protein